MSSGVSCLVLSCLVCVLCLASELDDDTCRRHVKLVCRLLVRAPADLVERPRGGGEKHWRSFAFVRDLLLSIFPVIWGSSS